MWFDEFANMTRMGTLVLRSAVRVGRCRDTSSGALPLGVWHQTTKPCHAHFAELDASYGKRRAYYERSHQHRVVLHNGKMQ